MTGSAKREVAIYLRAVNKMGPGTQAAGGELSKLAQQGDRVFKRLAQVGVAAMTAIATAAVVVGQEFEQALANTSSMFITAARDAQELNQWTTLLEKKARALGATTAFSATEAANAMYSLASGGMDANEVVASSDAVLKLAGATLSDMGSTAETVMSTMRQFSLEATEAERVTNVFAAGIQNSMLNMERLTYAMIYAGPATAAVGMKVEETTAALALLHNAGLKGSIAGTGLRMMFARLLKPTDDLQKVLGNTSLEVDGFAAVLDKLSRANLTAAQMTEMFGARAFNATQALVKEGPAGFLEMTEKLTGTTAAMQMYEHQMRTVQSQFKILLSGIQETAISLFDQLQPGVMGAVREMQNLVEVTRDDLIAVFSTLAGWADRIGAVFSEHGRTIADYGAATAVATTAVYAAIKAHIAWIAIINLTRVQLIALATTTGVGLLIAGLAIGIKKLVDHMGGWEMAWTELLRIMKVVALWTRDWFDNLKLDFKLFLDVLSNFPNAWHKTFLLVLQVVWGFLTQVGQAMTNLGKMLLNPWKAGDLWQEMQDEWTTGMNDLGEHIKTKTYEIVGEDAARAHSEAKDELKRRLNDDWQDIDSWYKNKVFDLQGQSWAGIPLLSAQNESAMFGPQNAPKQGAQASSGGSSGSTGSTEQRVARDLPQMNAGVAGLLAGGPSFIGMPEDFVTKQRDDADAVFNVWQESMTGIQQVGQRAWMSVWDSTRTTGEKMTAVFGSVRDFFWKMVGDMVTKKLTADAMILASNEATNTKEQANNAKTAATGFFKAYSSMPFVGQVLAIAAIGAMMGFLSKMHTGGLIGGRGAVAGSRRERMFIGQEGEYVMPAAQTRANLPLLEAMKKGINPAMTAAGGGGSPIAVTISVGEGSLLLADDDLAVRRFADAVHEHIERRLSKQSRR